MGSGCCFSDEDADGDAIVHANGGIARRVRARGGRDVTILDGPFAETKELLSTRPASTAVHEHAGELARAAANDACTGADDDPVAR